MTHDEIYEGRVARDKRNYPVMTHDDSAKKQLIAQIREGVEDLSRIHSIKHTRDGVQVDAGCLDPADVLDLLEKIEKELL